MRYLLLLLILSSCTTHKQLHQAITPEEAKVVVLSQDTLLVTLPDSLAHLPAQAQVQRVIRAKKFKNRGTVIIQTAPGSVASVVGKAKAPVATAAHDAAAIEKPKNSAVTTGTNSPATATTQKPGFPWWLLLLVAGGGYAWYRFKKA